MISLIIFFGFLLRIISINQSLWLDEATTFSTVSISISDFFNKFIVGDFHPPLYYLLFRLIPGRGLSILFGLGTIFLIYKIGEKIVNKKIGLFASLLIATSGLHIYYSQEARMYSMVTFLVCFLIYSYLCKKWLLFSLCLLLVAMTDYLATLIFPIFIVDSYLDRNNIKRIMYSFLPTLLFFVFWSNVFFIQLFSGFSSISNSPAWSKLLGELSFKEIFLLPVKFILGRVSFDNKIIYGFVSLIVTLLFFYLIYKSFYLFKKIKVVFLWLFFPFLIAILISFKIPVLNYFRFLFLLPAFYLLVSIGVFNFSKKINMLIVFVLLSINITTSSVYLFNHNFQREDWRGLVSFVELNSENKDSIVVFPSNSQMEAYKFYAKKDNYYSGNINFEMKTNKIFLLRYVQEVSDPSDSTRLKIESVGYRKTGDINFNGILVWRYEK